MFHYGSYETKFIEKMSKKYGRKEDEEIINKISSNLVNALSLIYANIYFPTYSNSLKDIGVYIGEKWSEENATGLQSLVWRHNWSETNDGILKEFGLINLQKAIQSIHQPRDKHELQMAVYRLKFNEHFFIQLLLAIKRYNIDKIKSIRKLYIITM